MAETITITQQSDNLRTYLPFDMYLPEELKDNEFFTAMRIMIDYTENNLLGFSKEKYAMIEQAYRDIGFKYKDIMKISEEALRDRLKEDGFEIILNLLDFDIEKLRMFVLYLPLFKALKGTDIGFNLIIDQISHDYIITSHLDDPVNIEEFTYEFTILTFVNQGFDANIIKNLAKFSRGYIYPVLKRANIQVIYRALAPVVYGRPIMTENITAKCFDFPE